jgi:hypothetical protein
MTDCSTGGGEQPSPKRVPLATVEQVLGLYRDRYFDANVQYFHEKLDAQHGIHLSYTWVKHALQGAGLVVVHPPRAHVTTSDKTITNEPRLTC